MARIVGIIDAYRAMSSDRPYRKALSRQEVVVELRKGAGNQFDPELVELFISAISYGEDAILTEAV
jgi:HD-GYP domain-containing protein (c-di-GMP phosphodiesterase class II)